MKKLLLKKLSVQAHLVSTFLFGQLFIHHIYSWKSTPKKTKKPPWCPTPVEVPRTTVNLSIKSPRGFFVVKTFLQIETSKNPSLSNFITLSWGKVRTFQKIIPFFRAQKVPQEKNRPTFDQPLGRQKSYTYRTLKCLAWCNADIRVIHHQGHHPSLAQHQDHQKGSCY